MSHHILWQPTKKSLGFCTTIKYKKKKEKRKLTANPMAIIMP